MPPRRPRRSGIQPWQDDQVREAKALLSGLTSATPAELQRTLRAPRLDALPPRRNLPELGTAAMLRLGAGEPANVRFEWQNGALTVVGYVDAASEKRARRAGAVLDAQLVSCNGLALQGKGQTFVMRRMQSCTRLTRQLGFAPPPLAEGPPAPPPVVADPAAARKKRLARAAAAAKQLRADREPTQEPFAAMAPSASGNEPQPPSLDSWLAREPYAAPPKSLEGHPRTNRGVAHTDPYSTGARRRRITHEHASRIAKPLIAEAIRRVQRRRLETLACVAWQRRRRGVLGRRKAVRTRTRRNYKAAVALQAYVRGRALRLRRLVAAVLLAQRLARRWLAKRLLRRMRARRRRTRAEACLAAQRALRGRRGRRVAARLRRARVGARRFFAIACVGRVPSNRRVYVRHATISRAGATGSRRAFF